ncbi:MAG TPA: UTP--glucose-1-phosphate uridylyltransferase GalU [Dehalococcoidia bacterium]|nr:UTP--glucose-1-phosphate uridylyltransferase GalU [Dehalococcoidia bacterium]
MRCLLREVRKAIILAAGYGSRLLPATKAQPKEMLPLVDRPIIHYAVEEAVQSGIKDVIIVTAIGKRAVEDYFDRSRDIEDLLRAKGDKEGLAYIRGISEMANFAYVRQGEMGGIGHAVMTARHLVDDDEPFVLFLPDDVIVGQPPATQQLIDTYNKHHASVVAVEEVPDSETSSYGIVAGEPVDERVTRLRRLVEKPAPGTAPSNLAIVGRYLLTPAIFEAIERTAPGYGGEIQITDALQVLADEEGMYALRFTGNRYDTGRPLTLLQASVSVGLSRPDIGPAFRNFLRNLDLGEE